MAALVASPPVSPLGSPTIFLHEHQEEQSDTTALIEDVLAAWAWQQPRSTASGRHVRLEEPSSYPFPSLLDGTRTVSDVPCPALSQGVDYPESASLDCESLFGQPDFASLFSDGSENATFNSVGNFRNDSTASAQAMLPVTCDAEPTRAGASVQASSNALFLPMSDEELLIQELLFQSNDSNPQEAPSSPRVKPPNPGSHSRSSDKSAIQTTAHLDLTGNFASQIIPLAPIPMAPALSLDWTVATPVDEHYSNVSSNGKRAKTELQHHNRLQYKDQNGSVVGTLFTLGHAKTPRQPFSKAARAQTKITRLKGACGACRANKKRCNRPESEYECCNNCKVKVHSMPCFVAKIVDAQLFRDKPSPNHPKSALRPAVFESLSNISHGTQRQRPIIVTLTQDLGLQMLVVLARYDPLPREVTHRVWKKDGQTRRIEMPPYCLASMEDTQQHMLEYIANFRSAWLRNVLGRSNDITSGLFDQAQRFAAFNPGSTVCKALDLCAASRIIERDWRICGGPADLGIPLVSDDEANPFFNRIPITPMMDAQLDQIVIHTFLLPTREALLASLQAKMTSPNRSSYFFEIFLTVSVLLSHAEWLLAHSRQNARRVGAKTRYNSIPRSEAYFHACNTFIAYWHHVCQGTCPAEMEWMDEGARNWARVDQEQAQFMESLKRKVNTDESKSMMLRLREENRYESELYWCHQLFFPNWKAGAKTVVEEAMTS